MSNHFTEWIDKKVQSDTTFALSETLRSPSLNRLAEADFPTRKDEEWRYTPLDEILESSPVGTDAPSIDTEFLAKCKAAMPEAHTLVFINGVFSATHSDNIVERNKWGLTIAPLTLLSGDQLSEAEEIISSSTLTDDNIFQHIALGLSQSGLFIHHHKPVANKPSLHILHISSGKSGTSFANPICVIKVAEKSHLEIVEQFVSQGSTPVISMPATYIQLESESTLDHYRLGLENARTNHVANSAIQVAKSAVFRSHQYLLGSHLTRSNMEIRFTGTDGQAVLRGVYLGEENQHLDLRTYMDHAYPSCRSDQHFRGILNGHSRGVFNGMVLVRKDAQKTDAQQSNKNLLLSRDARVDTKPQLEIYADDVKCAHGATIGELDNDALFYLQSRGIGKKDAALMLTRAFAAEVTQEIEIESLQDYVHHNIAEALDEIVDSIV